MYFTPQWLDQLLQTDDITDLCLNGSQEVFIDRGSGLEKVSISPDNRWTDAQLKTWVLEQFSRAGKTWDAKHPFLDVTVALGDGKLLYRLNVVFPPSARQGIMVSLRKLPSQLACKAEDFPRWSSSEKHYRYLVSAIKHGENIIISGGTGSGKTTLMGDLLSHVPENERLIALEDTPELMPDHPHFVSLVTRNPNPDGFGGVTLRSLLKQSLRMRPDRILLGECRGSEVLELLQVLNTGHKGTIATLHANSPRDALRRIELLCLLGAQGAIHSSVIRELLSSGIQLIVFVKREGKLRFISDVSRIEGKEGDIILLRPVVG